MNKTILRYFLTVLIVTLGLSSSISMVILSDIMLENTKHDMLYAVKLVEYQLDPQNNLKSQTNSFRQALQYCPLPFLSLQAKVSLQLVLQHHML